jgi:predicted RND superfamily exporter protein
MNNYFKAIDALGAGFGASKLEFSTNYRVFFSDANPELQAFENLQDTYAKNDNFLFVLESEDGKAFSAETLDAVERLTAEAWKIPYAIRVDSVTNFQHSHASDDDLIVEDLVKHARGRDASYLDEREAVALAEPLLRNQLLTPDGTVTAVNVVLQYPQKHLMEVPEAVAFARNLATGIEADFTAIEVHLTGVSMLNNAFAETGMQDGATLMPLMFGSAWVSPAGPGSSSRRSRCPRRS